MLEMLIESNGNNEEAAKSASTGFNGLEYMFDGLIEGITFYTSAVYTAIIFSRKYMKYNEISKEFCTLAYVFRGEEARGQLSYDEIAKIVLERNWGDGFIIEDAFEEAYRNVAAISLKAVVLYAHAYGRWNGAKAKELKAMLDDIFITAENTNSLPTYDALAENVDETFDTFPGLKESVDRFDREHGTARR